MGGRDRRGTRPATGRRRRSQAPLELVLPDGSRFSPSRARHRHDRARRRVDRCRHREHRIRRTRSRPWAHHRARRLLFDARQQPRFLHGPRVPAHGAGDVGGCGHFTDGRLTARSREEKMERKSDAVSTREIVCDNGMRAILAHPSHGGPFPIVVLMHERYGLVPHTRDLAQRCASDGFLVLAPDFFFRHPDKTALNAGASRYDMSDPEAVDSLQAAIAAAKACPAADASKVAVAGYCQTGRHPLVFAAQAAITAAVVWYGAAAKREWPVNERQPTALDDIIAEINCPIFAA